MVIPANGVFTGVPKTFNTTTSFRGREENLVDFSFRVHQSEQFFDLPDMVRQSCGHVVTRGEEQLHLWIDIDEAPRGPMSASLTMRREQIVEDITQLTFDAEHWSRVNPSEEPITIEKDFDLDVQIRRNPPV